MTRSLASRSWFGIVALVVVSGCGSGAAAGRPADHAEAGADDTTQETSDSAEASEEAEASNEAPAPACSDGTCTPCGDGWCPNGWYCDETAKGGPACGWLPECAKKPGCACVERALSSCSCEEREGGQHVTCK